MVNYAWCLDPCDLNEAICWDHHKMPTVEEAAHKLAHSHYFTKLDAHHGHWSIVLNQESSLLMTFNSPFGRYHFLQLPFGLVCSQDIFQKKMDQILEECQGCIVIADDITVHSHTKAEHNAHLQNLMPITCKYDLVFNPQKHTWRLKLSNSLAASAMPMVSTQTWEMLTPYMPYQYQQMSPNSRNS